MVTFWVTFGNFWAKNVLIGLKTGNRRLQESFYVDRILVIGVKLFGYP